MGAEIPQSIRKDKFVVESKNSGPSSGKEDMCV